MNRENKRKTFEKGYYKIHPCRDSFVCKVCGRLCTPENTGSDHRNHCPNCLSSLHVDTEPGDRASDCGGIMEPVAVWVRSGGEWAIIHRCKRCGALSSNRVAADDNPMKLMSIAMKPLCAPPFLIERIDCAHGRQRKNQMTAQSDCEYRKGVEMEVYPSANVSGPEYSCELWIAVTHK